MNDSKNDSFMSPEKLKEIEERALERKRFAEEENRRLEAEIAALENGEMETEEDTARKAAAEQKLANQTKGERRNTAPHKSDNSSQEDAYFKPELEKLIAMALEDGELTETEHNVLYRKAEELGVSKDELDMVLNSRIGKLQERKQGGGKAFIENLQREINEACVLKMGTYGKKVEDSSQTNRRREEIMLSANPTTPDEIKEYLYFLSGKLSSSEYLSSSDERCYDKFNTVCQKGRLEYPTNADLNNVISTLRNKVYEPQDKKSKKKIIICGVVAIVAFILSVPAGLVATAVAAFIIYKNISKIKSHQ